MSSMTVSVLLRLVDRLSGPAKQATAGLKGMAAGARAIPPAANAAGTANERLARSLNATARGGANASTSINGAASASVRAATAADRAASAFKRMGLAAEAAWSKVALSPKVATIEAYAAARGRIEAQMSRAGSGALAGGLTVGAVGFPLRRASDYELRLTRLGNVAGYNEGDNRPGAAGDTFGERIGALDKRFRADAVETRQNAGDIMLAVENLVARGMPQAEALAGGRLIGKAATATGTDIIELANMFFALRQNLGISEANMPKAFDIATQAGKLGGFELKDMAKWFPEMTVNYASLGLQGDQVGMQALASLSAMLQAARDGAATPDKAANNLANVLQKLLTKETSKNFEKAMGIDFAEVMQKAVQSGKDPVMHLVGLVQQFLAENENNMFKLGELGSDRQYLDGLRSIVVKKERVDEIMRKSLEADDVINRDFDRVSRTFAMRAKSLAIAADNLSNTLMTGPMGEGKGLLGGLTDTMNGLDAAAKKHPGITGGLMNVGLGLVGFALASKAFAWIAGGVKLGLLGLASAFFKFNAAGKNVAVVARLMRGAGAVLGAGGALGLGAAGGVAAAGVAMTRMTRLAYRYAGAMGVAKLAARGALRLTGIGLAVEGLYLLATEWDRVKALFKDPLNVGMIFPEMPEWLKRIWKAPFEENQALEQRFGTADKPSFFEWLDGKRAPSPPAVERHYDPAAEPFERVEPQARSNDNYSPSSGAAVDIMGRARAFAAGSGPASAVAGGMASGGMGQAPGGIEVVAQGPMVTFNQAPPQINISAPISITMNGSDPGAVGAAVSGHLNKVARGALHDGVTE